MAGWPNGYTPTIESSHETKTGREIGTVKWVGAYAGRDLQKRAGYSLSFEEVTTACDGTFTHWKRKRQQTSASVTATSS